MEGFASYEGSSGFLRWWPKVLLAAALGVLVAGGLSAIQWSVFCVLAAWVGGHFIPWRFGVFEDGVGLLFPFGRRLFLSRSVATVRVDIVGATVYNDRHGKRWFGYPLRDGILYRPGQESLLRAAFVERGFTLT